MRVATVQVPEEVRGASCKCLGVGLCLGLWVVQGALVQCWGVGAKWVQQALTSCEVSFELLERLCKCLWLGEVRGAIVQVPEGGASSKCLCLSEVRGASVQVSEEGAGSPRSP